jgi:hypothetical protein
LEAKATRWRRQVAADRRSSYDDLKTTLISFPSTAGQIVALNKGPAGGAKIKLCEPAPGLRS